MRISFGWATKDLIGWISRNIILPLTPFFMGALIRGLFRKVFNVTLFDPSELSFSMAMLCLLVSLSSSNLKDKHLSGSLTPSFAVGIFVFATLFAVAIMFEEIDQTQNAQTYAGTIDVIRWLTIAISLFTVTIAIVSKHKYKLEGFEL